MLQFKSVYRQLVYFVARLGGFVKGFVKRDFCDGKEPGMGLDSYSKVGFCPSVTDGIGSACAPLLVLWAKTSFVLVHVCAW